MGSGRGGADEREWEVEGVGQMRESGKWKGWGRTFGKQYNIYSSIVASSAACYSLCYDYGILIFILIL